MTGPWLLCNWGVCCSVAPPALTWKYFQVHFFIQSHTTAPANISMAYSSTLHRILCPRMLCALGKSRGMLKKLTKIGLKIKTKFFKKCNWMPFHLQLEKGAWHDTIDMYSDTIQSVMVPPCFEYNSNIQYILKLNHIYRNPYILSKKEPFSRIQLLLFPANFLSCINVCLT